MATNKKKELDTHNKINIPGVQLKELLELEDVFPNIRLHLTMLAIPLLIIAQITATCPDSSPVEILALESVNTYIRTLLSNNYSMRYIGAAIAIRRTMEEFGTSEGTQERLESRFTDLVDNASGKSSLRGNVKTALSSPDRMRAYRRGIMLNVNGTMQSFCVYHHRRISSVLEKINPSNLEEYLPYPTQDLDLNQIFKDIEDKLLSKGNPLRFIDGLDKLTQAKKVPMEQNFDIERSAPISLTVEDLTEEEVEALPAWKKIAYKSAKSMK